KIITLILNSISYINTFQTLNGYQYTDRYYHQLHLVHFQYLNYNDDLLPLNKDEIYMTLFDFPNQFLFVHLLKLLLLLVDVLFLIDIILTLTFSYLALYFLFENVLVYFLQLFLLVL